VWHQKVSRQILNGSVAPQLRCVGIVTILLAYKCSIAGEDILKICHYFSTICTEDAICESDRPYQSESADTRLASLVFLQSHVDMTPSRPTEDIANEFATEARCLKRIV